VSGHALVRLVALDKSYREGESRRQVLKGLHASFAAGEFTALTGRSGSGKSTLLNLVSGIDVPDAGEVHVDGVEIGALGDRDRTLHRRRRIGFVFQFFNLIPTLTVEENLTLPLELLATPGARARERVREMLDAVGLADRAASFPDRLSGGEQQRIALARALVHDPALVLADEPTGNLDAATGAEILDLLVRLVRGARRTVIMATHSAEAARVADRVLAIESGRVTERGASAGGAR